MGGRGLGPLGREFSPEPVKACYTISPDSSEPRRAPHSPCWQSRHSGNGSREPAPSTPARPARMPRMSTTGEEMRGKDQGEGQGFSLSGESTGSRKVSAHSHTHLSRPLSPSLSLPLSTPLSPSPPPSEPTLPDHSPGSHSNPGSWQLREDARSQGIGASVTTGCWGQTGGGRGQEGHRGSLSVSFPAGLSPC